MTAESDVREIQAAAREVLAEQCPPAKVRASYDDPEAWRPLWHTLVELGWAGLLDPEIGGPPALCAVLEECGAATLPAPLLSSSGHAFGALCAASGDAAEGARDRLVEGEVATLLVGAERGVPGPGLRVSSGRVGGVVHQVADAERAQLFVGLAAADDGSEQIVVLDRSSVEITATGEPVDPSRPLAEVAVDTGDPLAIDVPTHQALTLPLLASAAELVGVARRALEISVEHARNRRQFGVPIGSFQGVKHKLADVHVAIERARALVTLGARALSGDETGSHLDIWSTVCLAKAAANDAALAATRAGVSVHGAIAQTWEHDMHLLLRRAWVGSALLGSSAALYAEAGTKWMAS